MSNNIKILRVPDNSTNVILQCRGRFKLENITSTQPYLKGEITSSNEIMPKEDDKEFSVLMRSIREITYKILQNLGDEGKEMFFAIKNIDSPFYLINFLSANFPIEPAKKQKLLEQSSIKKRAYTLYSLLTTEAKLIEIKADIQSKTREDITQQQCEHFPQ